MVNTDFSNVLSCRPIPAWSCPYNRKYWATPTTDHIIFILKNVAHFMTLLKAALTSTIIMDDLIICIFIIFFYSFENQFRGISMVITINIGSLRIKIIGFIITYEIWQQQDSSELLLPTKLVAESSCFRVFLTLKSLLAMFLFSGLAQRKPCTVARGL